MDIGSHREEPLASHHFLLGASIACGVQERQVGRELEKSAKLDRARLEHKEIAEAFRSSFQQSLAPIVPERQGIDVNATCWTITKGFNDAAKIQMVNAEVVQKRPWIRQQTLDLISDRKRARVANNWVEEQRLSKMIRASARNDRRCWLSEIAGSGSWHKLRKLRRGAPHQQGRPCGVEMDN